MQKQNRRIWTHQEIAAVVDYIKDEKPSLATKMDEIERTIADYRDTETANELFRATSAVYPGMNSIDQSSLVMEVRLAWRRMLSLP